MIVLVTGSSGFLGRHFVQELARRGDQVVTCDIAAERNPRDFMELYRSAHFRFDLVIHCAARAPHRKAIDTQPATMIYNQLLDAAVFEWAIRAQPRHLLYLSSSAVYPVGLQTVRASRFKYRLTESDTNIQMASHETEPDAAYGRIKRTGEGLAQLANQAGVMTHVVRPFSGYGEDQSADFPFGRFVQQVRAREPVVKIWGHGHQVRDWIHVDDVVRGALAVVDSGITMPINLCTGVGTNMIDLVTMMTKAAGYTPRIEFVDGPVGVAVRVGNPDLMNTVYTSKILLEEGVDLAIKGG